MLMKYIRAAIHHARYEILADDGSFYGEIPVCNGVYANALTLEDCREQLNLADPDQARTSVWFGSARLFARWYTDLRQGKHVVAVVVSEREPRARH